MVTMVWVVSRFRFEVETSFTRSQKSITMIELTREDKRKSPRVTGRA